MNHTTLYPRPGSRRVQLPPRPVTGAADYSDLKPGQRVRVTLEGTVEQLGDASVPLAARKRLRLAAGVTISAMALQRADALVVVQAPPSSWQAGDVVVVRYGGPSSTAYTYVRLADGSWSGNFSDAEADNRIDTGAGTWAMRDGRPVAQGTNVPRRPNGVVGSLPF